MRVPGNNEYKWNMWIVIQEECNSTGGCSTLPGYKYMETLQPRRQQTSYSPPWGPEILLNN